MKTATGWKALYEFEKMQAEHREIEAMSEKKQSPTEDSQKSLDGQSHPTLNQAAWHDSINKVDHRLKMNEVLDALIVRYGRNAKIKDVIDQIYDEAYRAYEEKVNGGEKG